ncbi:MAG: DUF4382 domain-containing protein [Candidatus Bathyarchaeota archaeon]|nr:DUF4382 domain-containing protein [Candidatus Bathyarchaeota archaeon]
MAYEKKDVITRAIAGVLTAVLIISGLLWTGVVPQLTLPPTEEKGFVVIKITDAPADLQELWLQIDEVKVHRKGYGNETWTNITVIEMGFFNLLSLQNISLVLAAGELPVGNYTEIRFHVVDAWANTTQESHKQLQITTPWVKVKQSFFTIKETPITTIKMDVTVNEQPIISAGKLIPVAKAEVTLVE